MQNHAYQLAQNTNYQVYLIGYLENIPRKDILDHPMIQIINIQSRLVEKLKKLPKALYIVYAVLRIIIQLLQLMWLLMVKYRSFEFIVI